MQQDMLRKLLLRTQHKSRLWAALSALTIGTSLLLVSVLIWWNFSELLYGKNQNDTLGSTFITIGKRVTEHNMGVPGATLFTPEEIDSIRKAPEVLEVGLISSNHFPVYAKMGGKLAFETDMVLESVPDKFIDKLPAEWKWEPGMQSLPIIVSSHFLDLYNYVFAPSQGMPQLSETSIKNVALILDVGKAPNKETVIAHIVGFSDRIESVLAPQSFIDYGNKRWGNAADEHTTSQVILKAKDPSNTKFTNFLERHDYSTNSQNLRWSKIRAVVEVVVSATGILALLLMGISTLVFILFIELTIARAQQSLTLLLQIGYSPRHISRFMINRFLPMVLGTIIVSVLITLGGQAIASKMVASQSLVLPMIPGWPVWAATGICTLVLVLLVARSISSSIKKQ